VYAFAFAFLLQLFAHTWDQKAWALFASFA